MKIIIDLQFKGKISEEIKREYAEMLIDELSETIEGERNVWQDIEGGQGSIKAYSIKPEEK